MRNLPLVLLLVVVVLGPVALRPRTEKAAEPGERSLVVVSPHNEAIRSEFGRAFAKHYLSKHGQRVRLDWRTPGGTSEIARYVAAEYLTSFQNHWTQTLKMPWAAAVERSFDNPRVELDATPDDDTLEQRARRAFLDSNVTCRIDLFFGGGSPDFISQAAAGRLVDSGVIAAHPELFGDHGIPQKVSGEPYWDPQGRWIGTCVSAFGICYNVDALQRIGAAPPTRWEDLTDPRYFRGIALANPTQSSSVNRSFEMVIQQQMHAAVERRTAAGAGVTTPADEELAGVREGWLRGLQIIQRIGANARYFTDASSKVALDVQAGDAAAGMTIDFFGRFQAEAVQRADGTSRLHYGDVPGGSSFNADPIGMFRGAPNREIAREFIQFVISPEGQKLWNFKVGTPGGPGRYALRRLPILPALYEPEFQPFRSDPGVAPYELAKGFAYREKWTGPVFKPLAFVIRVMCIDTHDELRNAWRALIDANFPPEATAVFSDLSAVDHTTASGRIKEAFGSIKIKEVQLAKELSDRFRTQYRRATELAQAGR
ncbi:MAG TPA: extracellular solute-binding protein [Chthoniobacteraceae bacterium]|jgi:ABC-type Fe3+ transport system substrate-binding protein